MNYGWEIKVAVLHIRSGPGTNYEIIGDTYKGDILESPDGWIPVYLEDNSVGWISAQYAEKVETEETPAHVPGAVTGKVVVAKAMTQAGDPYIFGVEVDLGDIDPDAFDCSELVQWTCAQLKIKPAMPDGAANQMEHCRKHGTLGSIADGVRTAGALLFRIPGDGNNHVVISRGDGTTIEAKGSAYGVGVFSAANRGWTHAGLIPGVSYT